MADRVLAEGTEFVPEVMLPKLLGETTREHRPGWWRRSPP